MVFGGLGWFLHKSCSYWWATRGIKLLCSIVASSNIIWGDLFSKARPPTATPLLSSIPFYFAFTNVTLPPQFPLFHHLPPSLACQCSITPSARSSSRLPLTPLSAQREPQEAPERIAGSGRAPPVVLLLLWWDWRAGLKKERQAVAKRVQDFWWSVLELN